jgi:WD40 repeat protein
MCLIIDNIIRTSPLSAPFAAFKVDDFLLVVVVIIFVLSSIFNLSSCLDHSAFATFPGENGKIAFTIGREGNAEIYVMNADGSGRTRLTNNPGDDINSSWSPEGTKIAFASRQGIYVINEDDGYSHSTLKDSE